MPTISWNQTPAKSPIASCCSYVLLLSVFTQSRVKIASTCAKFTADAAQPTYDYLYHKVLAHLTPKKELRSVIISSWNAKSFANNKMSIYCMKQETGNCKIKEKMTSNFLTVCVKEPVCHMQNKTIILLDAWNKPCE